jgi:hypothetical protein
MLPCPLRIGSPSQAAYAGLGVRKYVQEHACKPHLGPACELNYPTISRS